MPQIAVSPSVSPPVFSQYSAQPPVAHVTPRAARPAQAAAAAGAAGQAIDRSPRMRWARASEGDRPLLRTPIATPHSPQSGDAAPATPGSAPSATAMLTTLKQLAQRLERYDNRNLGDYGSVLRVADHRSVLDTRQLMALPGRLARAKTSVARSIAALARPGAATERLLSECRRVNAEARSLLDGLKRIHPLPRPDAYQADAAGRLVPAHAGSRASTPRSSASSPAMSFRSADITPDERAFIASLRSPISSSGPGASPVKTTPSRIPLSKIRSDLQTEQRSRDEKLWRIPAREKTDLAGALDTTGKDLQRYLDREPEACSGSHRKAAADALARIASSKKKCERLDPADTSPAARKLRERARNENIRACNLLDSLGFRKTGPAKPSITPPPDRNTMPAKTDAAQTPQVRPRSGWSPPGPLKLPRLPSISESGFGSEGSDRSDASSPETSLLSMPAAEKEHPGFGHYPSWVLKHLEAKGKAEPADRGYIRMRPSKVRVTRRLVDFYENSTI
jgi:hypothetical protein